MEITDEVLDTIDYVVNQVSRKFTFGYYDIDDIKQEARILAMESLPRYDNKRSLKNFLWAHVYKRLCNLKRDKFERITKPCDKCPLSAYCKTTDSCSAYEDKLECKLYYGWFNRNQDKRHLMSPVSIYFNQKSEESNHAHSSGTYEPSYADSNHAESIEIKNILNELPLEFRSNYLKMLHGIKLTKPNQRKLKEAIEKILEDKGMTIDDLI